MYHYVYEITNNINGKKYIGKRSCKCEIENDKYMGSGIAIGNAKKKYGIKNFSKRIIKILDSEEQAFDFEKYWIKKCNAVKSRMFYNIKDGGEGNTSEDIKRIIANMSEETKKIRGKKLSIANSGKNNSMYGKTGKDNPVSKEVIMFSTEGNILKKFNCIREANDSLNKSRAFSFISRVCREKRGTAYGYRWLFKEDYEYLINNNKFDNWFNQKPRQRNNYEIQHKKIYMLNPNNFEIINTYNSISEASDKTNILSSGISRCCRHGCNTAGGYSWIFVDEYCNLNKDKIYNLYKPKYKPIPIESRFKRKVVCVTTGQIFDSIKYAISYFGLCKGAKIDSACKGKRKTIGKHPKTGEALKWMYYEEYIKIHKKNELQIAN